jgi:hypothetical protein
MLKQERLIKAVILAAALEEDAVSALIAAEIRKLEYVIAASGSLPGESSTHNLQSLQQAVARIIEALAQKQAMICRTLDTSRRLMSGVNDYEC